MLVAAILVCEIGFWVFLVAGLAVRYLLRKRRLSTALLLCSPLLDAGLLILAALDLGAGATATRAHALAAAYIGFTVAFGHSLISWADRRFAHHVNGGPAPVKPPRSGWGRVRHEWREFGKAALGWVISCALLGLGTLIAADLQRAQALLGFMWVLTIVVVVWFVVGPLSSTVSAMSKREQGS